MKKYTKSALAALLAVVFIASSLFPIFAVDSAAEILVYSDEYNSGERDVICTTLDGTGAQAYYEEYYDDENVYEIFLDMTSSELLTSLNALMKSTHTTITTYANCRDMAYRTDCENEAGASIETETDRTLILFYTSYEATRGQWNGWNREHVWPQSLGGGEFSDSAGEKGGGADLHHVRPADAGVNSSRGNKPYGESGDNPSEKLGSNPAEGVLGGTYNETYFEPNDNVKGDVARICLYVWARWGEEWLAESVTEVFQSVDVLLEWCEEDPVDTWEMGRNEVVESIQGNRNVFIDYPELAWLLFNRPVPSDMTTPSGEAKITAENCPHINTERQGAFSPVCGNDGYTGDLVCTRCDKVIELGEAIPTTGNHGETEIRNALAPTCGVAGYTGDSCCTLCDAVVARGEEIAPTGEHSSITMTKNEKQATCVSDGYTGDVCCGRCGEVVVEGRVTAKTGVHSYGEIIVLKEPTLISKGLGKYVCVHCSAEYAEYIPPIESEGEMDSDDFLAAVSSDAERILLLLALGVTDASLLDELSK